jgi:spore maturation protein CgeB
MSIQFETKVDLVDSCLKALIIGDIPINTKFYFYLVHNGQIISKHGWQKEPHFHWNIEKAGAYKVRGFVDNGSDKIAKFSNSVNFIDSIVRSDRSYIKRAAEAYSQARYDEALVLYQEAAILLGEKNFRVNIHLCLKKLGRAVILPKFTDQSPRTQPPASAVAAPRVTDWAPNFEKRPSRFASEFKVALIADEFTYNSFKDEFKAIVLEPDSWRQQFEESQPDIFFCESAWSGPDSTRRPWKGQVYASVNFAKENRTVLLDILAHCRQAGIPTVFWNKEDPTHFPDRVHDFVKTAREFDFVFTTAAECVELYRKEHGVANVFALPFATNPRLFNPVEKAERSSRIVFAGSWYANHKQRSIDMETVLDDMRAGGFEPEIYDRYHGAGDPLHNWPDKYQPFIRPGQPHERMPEVYKASRFGLNFNTVVDSTTMFARRVFELMSCNTLVVSNYSRGVDEMFGELVVFADRQPGRLGALAPDQIDELRQRALTLVLREHTYKRRWLSMLSAIGMPHRADDESVTVVCVVRTRADALAAIAWFQQYGRALPGARLLLVGASELPGLEVAQLYQEFNRFGVAVTSFSHAHEYALEGRYRPIETPYFMLVEPQNAPAPGWTEQALLHLQYMSEHLIAPASGKHDQYQLRPATASTTLLGHAAMFNAWLKSDAAPSHVYLV